MKHELLGRHNCIRNSEAMQGLLNPWAIPSCTPISTGPATHLAGCLESFHYVNGIQIEGIIALITKMYLIFS